MLFTGCRLGFTASVSILETASTFDSVRRRSNSKPVPNKPFQAPIFSYRVEASPRLPGMPSWSRSFEPERLERTSQATCLRTRRAAAGLAEAAYRGGRSVVCP